MPSSSSMRHLRLAAVLVLAALVLVEGRQPCRRYAVRCTGHSRTDNCNISSYREFKGYAANSFLKDISIPNMKDLMRSNWLNFTESCYIEAVLDTSGRILYIRFASERSLLVGQSGSSPWNRFGEALSAHESHQDGMQMLMELDGTQVCAYAWSYGVHKPQSGLKFQARFTRRSSVANNPMQRYTMPGSQFVEGVTDFAELDLMQPNNSAVGDGALLSAILKGSRRAPRVLWIYKCMANTGFMDLPCNSEANVHLYLRQWINHSTLYDNVDDFYTAENWRYFFLSSDYTLLILMVLTSVYVGVHLTCLVWIGLSSACVKLDR